MKEALHPHVKRLRTHRNVLYGFVVALFLLYLISFVVFSSRLAQVHASNTMLAQTIERDSAFLQQIMQSQINELVQVIHQQRKDIQKQLSEQEGRLGEQLDVVRGEAGDFTPIIKQVIPGVVSIGTDRAAGTGFIVNSGGYIATNEHIIRGAPWVKVLTHDGKIREARVIGQDSSLDVAVLKIEGLFDPLRFASENATNVGSKVVAIGNPLGLSFSVSEGIVSALHRQGPNGQPYYIQTDVTLNPGNSGGPLINREGMVIGMNNFKIGDAEGLGFALEARYIQTALSTITNGTLTFS